MTQITIFVEILLKIAVQMKTVNFKLIEFVGTDSSSTKMQFAA